MPSDRSVDVDAIIEARCGGASLDDIYSSIKAGSSCDGLVVRESLQAVADLLSSKVDELNESMKSGDYEELKDIAESLREISSMLEGISDEEPS